MGNKKPKNTETHERSRENHIKTLENTLGKKKLVKSAWKCVNSPQPNLNLTLTLT